MKTILKTMLAIGVLAVSSIASAQTTGINYQATVRDASGGLMVNQSVDVIFSIIESSPSGTIKYIENQTLTTNAYGGFVAIIGQGNPTQGTFNSILWGNNNHFLNVNVDGNDLGTIQFMSVPYALHAKDADYAHDATDAEYADLAGEISNPIWKRKQSNGDYFTEGEPVIIGDSVADAQGLTISLGKITSSTAELVDLIVDTLEPNRDVLNMKVGSNSANNGQFIECKKANALKFVVDVDGTVRLAKEINRIATGAADMIPIAYGYVNALGVLSLNNSTPNVSCTKIATGKYEITISGESYNITDYIAIVSAQGVNANIISSSYSNSKLTVHSFNHFGSVTNAPFRFIVYKP